MESLGTSLSNSWIVPETPTSQGALLYYWNGIEDGGSSGGGGVLQPVLQHASGGSWGIKSWYVGTGGTVTSGLVPTPVGSKVVGSMVQNSDGTWTCTGAPEGGESATLNFNRRTPVFTYAYEVLEAYSMGSCSMYLLSQRVFVSLTPKLHLMVWMPQTKSSGCHIRVQAALVARARPAAMRKQLLMVGT